MDAIYHSKAGFYFYFLNEFFYFFLGWLIFLFVCSYVYIHGCEYSTPKGQEKTLGALKLELESANIKCWKVNLDWVLWKSLTAEPSSQPLKNKFLKKKKEYL